ncbi:cell division protein FtsQ/DivIB [Thiogranum longum]
MLSFGWVKPMLALTTLLGSAGGLVMLLSWMKDPHYWPVQAVHIEGKFRHLQREQLQGEISPLASAGFFAMNVGEIQAHIQQMAWVEQVSVRRVWPDQLKILLKEQQPVAYWGDAAYLNGQAQVFEPQQRVELTGLPYLEGPDGYEQRVLTMYQGMGEMLQSLKLRVKSLRLDARRAWRLQLSNGLTIEIGRNDPVDRVARFVRVYPAILASGNGRVVAVDLRYSNGFAVRLQQLEEQLEQTG